MDEKLRLLVNDVEVQWTMLIEEAVEKPEQAPVTVSARRLEKLQRAWDAVAAMLRAEERNG